MSLRFHFLNVGHGSSVVVEYEPVGGGGRQFGVVDSNAPASGTPRIVAKLRALGAKQLSFVCLTHPHRDHYSGLIDVLREFPVAHLFTCPFGDLIANPERLRKYAKTLARLKRDTDSATARKALHELMQILMWADDHSSIWEECDGENRQLGPTGFAGVQIHTILPPRRAKAQLIRRIETMDVHVYGTIDDNDLSLAITFEYCGRRVLLAGDATKGNWEVRKRYEDNTHTSPSSDVVNVPHHGSRHDNPDAVLERLFLVGDAYAITSANGLSHPAPEVIQWLASRSIQPYCTNLMPMCGGGKVTRLQPSILDPTLDRMLREHSITRSEIEPCQGDISVEIDSAGNVSVLPERARLCPYRPNPLMHALSAP